MLNGSLICRPLLEETISSFKELALFSFLLAVDTCPWSMDQGTENHIFNFWDSLSCSLTSAWGYSRLAALFSQWPTPLMFHHLNNNRTPEANNIYR